MPDPNGPPTVLARIVSGGQTGVDRAALNVALTLGIDCGGWCPLGRKAEDGPIPDRYPVRETETTDYAERTRLNVHDSDATLALTSGTPSGGTALTLNFARDLGHPVLAIDPTDAGLANVDRVHRWIAENEVASLNVAGPRESTISGIGATATAFLYAVLRQRRPTTAQPDESA